MTINQNIIAALYKIFPRTKHYFVAALLCFCLFLPISMLAQPAVSSQDLETGNQAQLMQIRYQVSLHANQTKITLGQSIKFEAVLEPPDQNAEYNFIFDDGKTSGWIREPNTEYTYRFSGEFQAFVQVRSGEQILADSPTIAVTVEEIQYETTLRISNRNPAAGEDLRFEGSITPGAEGVRFRFVYGNGEQSEWLRQPAIDYSYSKPGRYRVALMAVIGGQTFRSSDTLITVRQIVLNLAIVDSPPYFTEKPIKFTLRPAPDIKGLQFQFNYGDDSASRWQTNKTVEHVYTAPRQAHAIAVARKDGKILAQSNPVSLTIKIEYKVDLTVNNTKPFSGEDVSFEGSLDPSAQNVSYRFDFGDGTQSAALAAPVTDHFYRESGRYSAALAVVIDGDTIRSSEIEMTVSEITLNFELISRPPHYTKRFIEFRAGTVPDIPDLQYQYHFGDGSASDWTGEKVFDHAYAASSVNRAFVLVRKGADVLTRSSEVEVRVIPSVYNLVLQVDKTAVLSGETIRSSGSIRPTAAQALYRFDFKDGQKSEWLSDPKVSHVYETPGTYAATLTAKIDALSAESSPVQIRIGSEFKALIEVLPKRVKPGEVMVFSASTEPRMEDMEYMFFFGDGETSEWSNDSQASHVYSERGTYKAEVLARWAGKYESKSDLIPAKVSIIPSWLIWGLIPLGMVIIFQILKFFRSRTTKEEKESPAGKVKFEAQAKKDQGIQYIKSEDKKLFYAGLRIKPVADPGHQRIQTKGSSIIKKRKK